MIGDLLPDEEVREIVGTNGMYFVTSYGRVISANYRRQNRAKELKQTTHPEGYKRVNIDALIPKWATPVHRLVAIAFHENPENLLQVNHIDGDKGNNFYLNLEWVSNADNQKHAFRTGLQPHKRGERHPLVKLTEAKVLSIRNEYDASIGVMKSSKILGEKYVVSKFTIWDIVQRKTWNHI